MNSEAFSMNDRLSSIVKFLSCYPHFWNVDIEERIDPPIQTQYFLSGTATTLIFAAMFWLAKFLSSLVSLSGNPA